MAKVEMKRFRVVCAVTVGCFIFSIGCTCPSQPENTENADTSREYTLTRVFEVAGRQGIAVLEGDLYITADDGDAELGEADNLWRVRAETEAILASASRWANAHPT